MRFYSGMAIVGRSGASRDAFPSGAWERQERGEAALRGTHSQAALGNDRRGAKQIFAGTHSQAELGNDRERGEAELRGDAFPSRAWERHVRVTVLFCLVVEGGDDVCCDVVGGLVADLAEAGGAGDVYFSQLAA